MIVLMKRFFNWFTVWVTTPVKSEYGSDKQAPVKQLYDGCVVLFILGASLIIITIFMKVVFHF